MTADTFVTGWLFRAGAPLRMMCAFAGEACEDKHYGDFPTWAADKEELK